MKKLIVTLLFTVGFSTLCVAQLRTPALSSSAEIKQTVGLTAIEIEYSRPSARKRKIFGTEGLIPIDKFWRTGANAATKLVFSDAVSIGNKALKKGTYSILTKYTAESWAIYFYPYESSNWNDYVKQEPVVIVYAKDVKSKDFLETFTIGLEDVTLNSANLVLSWAQTKVVLPLKVEDHEHIMADIKSTMSGPSGNDYFQAALYMHETNTDLNKALVYIQKVTKGDSPLFFQVYREALILSDLNRNSDAIEIAKKALDLAEKAGNEDFVRLNRKLIEKLSS